MITVDTTARVRRAYFVQKRKIKAIARELKLARNTVRDIVRAGAGGETERAYVRKEQPLPQLGDHVAALETMLADNVTKARRERLTYQRMYEELRLGGFTGGYDAVRRYGRGWTLREGERTAQAFVPLIFAPGEAFQFDWSHEGVVLDGVNMTVKVAQVRLCHSRMLFVRAYPRETQEMVFDAHEKAFAFFKGAPKRGIYDNMKTAVETVFVGKERAFNRRFEQLDEPPPDRADSLHAGGRLGEGAGREPGRCRARPVLRATPVVCELRGPERVAGRQVRGLCQEPAASGREGENGLRDVRGRAAVPDGLSRRLRRLPCDGCVGVEDLPRPVRSQQVLGDVEGRRPSRRRACVCRPDRHQAGRRRRRRACPPLRAQPDGLRSLALRAGAGEEAGRPAQWRAVQGLAAARCHRQGAGQARRHRRGRPADGQGPHRRADRWLGRGRGRLRGIARRRCRQRRRDPQCAGAPPAARAHGADRDAGAAGAELSAPRRLRPLRQPARRQSCRLRSCRPQPSASTSAGHHVGGMAL